VAAANEYGVTAATLQVFIADLTISASSSPSSSQVAEIISIEAEGLRGMASRQGIATDGLTSSAPAYGVLRQILCYRCVSVLLRARNRGEGAESYAKQAAFDWQRLTEDPQSVSTGATANLVESVAEWATRTGTTPGRDTFDRSSAGRIVTGGSL